MTGSKRPEFQPLLEGVSQDEVDFVIPKLGVDVPLGIDPFLLYKSRVPEFRVLHDQILRLFERGLSCVKNGNLQQAASLLNFPEVPEIGLGYTKSGKRGAGVGGFLTSLILETLQSSPVLLERGIRHIEELQLVSMRIGPDRVSDITANIIKGFLISYTQKQCQIWNISLQKDVPVSHVYDEVEGWTDGYYDLPISPIDRSAILFVPRRIVRALPWINYEDFVKLEFAVYLRAKSAKSKTAKSDVIAVTRKEIDRIDKYIKHKEETKSQAQPTSLHDAPTEQAEEVTKLVDKLAGIEPGREQATFYQRTVLEILNHLFLPELVDGELEVRTIDGTERRDIIFTNDSDINFWSYVRSEHSSLFVMFETKNTQALDSAALNQTATYIGDRLGRLAFIVSRHPASESAVKKAFAIFNDSGPRKIILFLSDADLSQMLHMKGSGKSPTSYLQQLYRKFRTSVQ